MRTMFAPDESLGRVEESFCACKLGFGCSLASEIYISINTLNRFPLVLPKTAFVLLALTFVGFVLHPSSSLPDERPYK